VAKPDGTEIDVEEAPVNLFQSDVVASEQGSDEDAVRVPADASVARDETGLEMARVGDGLELFGEGPRGRFVEIGRHGTVEGLVGADVVVLGAEGIESPLLAAEVRAGWPGGLSLEDEVHVLVLAVLLGTSGLDELRLDPELDEPNREAREPPEGVGGEGGSVVGTDAVWQAEFLEEPGEDGKDTNGPGVGPAAAVEDETGVHVLDGEGIAELPVTGGKLSFEVRGPGVIGLGREDVWSAWMPATKALTAFGNEVVA